MTNEEIDMLSHLLVQKMISINQDAIAEKLSVGLSESNKEMSILAFNCVQVASEISTRLFLQILESAVGLDFDKKNLLKSLSENL